MRRFASPDLHHINGNTLGHTAFESTDWNQGFIACRSIVCFVPAYQKPLKNF
jgi:hypothetical protein